MHQLARAPQQKGSMGQGIKMRLESSKTCRMCADSNTMVKSRQHHEPSQQAASSSASKCTATRGLLSTHAASSCSQLLFFKILAITALLEGSSMIGVALAGMFT